MSFVRVDDDFLDTIAIAQLGTTATDASGLYLFDQRNYPSMAATTTYTVSIPIALNGVSLAGLQPTLVDGAGSGGDAIDSDGAAVLLPARAFVGRRSLTGSLVAGLCQFDARHHQQRRGNDGRPWQRCAHVRLWLY